MIAQQYDQMVKYATALRLGTAEAEQVPGRFTRGGPRYPTDQATDREDHAAGVDAAGACAACCDPAVRHRYPCIRPGDCGHPPGGSGAA